MRRGTGGIQTGSPPLHNCVSLVLDVREALIWASERPVQLAMLEREEITQQIEEAGRQQVKMGHSEAWYHQADAAVRAVAGKANGMLLQMLLKASLFVDTEFPNPLREGSLLRGAVVSHTLVCFSLQGPICWTGCHAAALVCQLIWRTNGSTTRPTNYGGIVKRATSS